SVRGKSITSSYERWFMIVSVHPTAPSDRRPATSGQPAAALRGELWQRHLRLQDMDPASAEYDAAVSALLDLTVDLLRAEFDAGQQRGLAWRRLTRFLYNLGAALLAMAIVAAAMALPAIGGWSTRWAYASVVVVALVAATLIFRRRVAPPPEPAVS